jgi:hypothetical protein
MTISIRPFDSADLDQVLQLERDVFGRDAWADDVFIAELAHPRSYYLVAEDHSVIVGFGGLRTPDQRGGQQTFRRWRSCPVTAPKGGVGRSCML